MKFKLFVAFALVCLILSSCATSSGVSNLSTGTTYLTVEIFQTLTSNTALARTKDWKVVRIITDTDVYYDGLSISTYFVFMGTYTYTNKEGDSKTVPVYMKQTEYKKRHSTK